MTVKQGNNGLKAEALSDLDEVLSLLEDDEDVSAEDKNRQVDLSQGDEDGLMLDLSEDDLDSDVVMPEGGADAAVLSKEDFALDAAADDKPAMELHEDELDSVLPEGMLPGATLLFVQKEEEEPSRETNWEEDADHTKFISYMTDKLKAIPAHSGQTTVGCEKAISYLRKLDREISKAIQTDDNNVIDESQAEKLRDIIHSYVTQLEDALEQLTTKKRSKKTKKKSSFMVGKQVVTRLKDGKNVEHFVAIADGEDDEKLLKVELVEPTDQQIQAFFAGEDGRITKEAGQIVTFVDPFLQSITRLLIRAHITQGKDLQEVYQQLDAQYEFSPREQLSIHELLLQKGMPLNVDLGRINEKNPNQFDGKNVEYTTEYYS